jgi:hypothetical protein
MKALISTTERRSDGIRVAQVEPDENIFPVADSMFWVDCPDDLVADEFYWDGSSFVKIADTLGFLNTIIMPEVPTSTEQAP